MNWYILLLDMVELGYGDVLSIAQTIGIVTDLDIVFLKKADRKSLN